ncbi:MAG: glycosyl hydrolase family 8 [Pseudomonadota bacterium]
MKTRHRFLFPLALPALLTACASTPPAGGGSGGATTGGATGTGGANMGTGGAVAGTGSNTSGLILGMGGPYPFPQNKKPGMCTLTTVANASAAVQSAYDYWKTTFLTSGNGTGLRVRRPTNQDDTVSEGIGYGMIAAAYMADRTTFDGLLTYAKSHLNAHGLMSWHLSSSGSVLDPGSASDGDADIIWALIIGSNQWSSAAYLNDARTMINAMSANSIAPDGMLKPGDGWGGTPLTNPSYFAPSYFRVFAAVTGDNNWKGVILDRNYAILANVTGTNGLVPDWTNNQSAVNQGTLMGMYDNSHYGYDAGRTPWRIALDYCFHGEPRALAYLTKVGAFFNGLGAANIGDQYSLNGQQTMGNKNMAFIGPAGVSGMAGFQSLLDGAFTYGATNNGGNNAYFPQSLRVLTMLMMSGNFVDFTKPMQM